MMHTSEEDSFIALHITLSPYSEDAADLISDSLADAGFDSFLPQDDGLVAYCQEGMLDASAMENALTDIPIPVKVLWQIEKMQRENWNSRWEEEGFVPIAIGKEILVHSPRHEIAGKAEFDICIDPRMAFGSGSHATTRMLLEMLHREPLQGKSVIDMGTGTGILSIFCAMKGAKDVAGIEIDRGAYENAIHNAVLNNTSINFVHGDAASLSPLAPADYFLANINRNIILADLPLYNEKILPGGYAFFSGFLEEDVDMVKEKAIRFNLEMIEKSISPDGWVALKFRKSLPR